jgi:hypothetical protein
MPLILDIDRKSRATHATLQLAKYGERADPGATEIEWAFTLAYVMSAGCRPLPLYLCAETGPATQERSNLERKSHDVLRIRQ